MAKRQVTFLINANASNFNRGINSAAKKFKKFGRDMERMGRSMTRNITAPLLAAAGGVTKMASDFESSMTKIETLVGLSRTQVQGMQKDVLSLAREAGKAPLELSEALFTVTSAGLRGAEAMNVLERAAKASAIGLGNTRDIAQATTAVMQAYASTGMTASEATDTLTAIVREGNLEASELAPTLGRVVGIASQLGISFQEVGASIATFTRLGVSSEEAVVGLRGVMNALLKPTQQGKQALDEIGLTFDSLREKVTDDGLMSTLRFLVEEFDGNDEALARLIPNVRALSAVLGTAGAQGETYEQVLNNIQQTTGIVDDGFERVSETAQFKFNKALSSLKTSAIGLGNILLPVATKIIDAVQDMADWFSRLSDQSKTLGLKIAAVAAAIGPTVFLIGKLSTGIGLVAVAIAGLMSPITLIIAGVSALALTFEYLRRNSDVILAHIGNGFTALKNKVVKEVADMLEGISRFAKFLPGFTDLSFIQAQAAVLSLTEPIPEVEKKFQSMGEFFKGLGSDIAGYMSGVTGFGFSDIFSGSGGSTGGETDQGGADSKPSIGRASMPGGNRMQQISQGFNKLAQGADKFKFSLKGVSKASQIGMDIANDFTNAFGAGMANVVVQAERLGDALKNIGKLLLSSAIQKGISLLLTGGLSGSGFFGSGGGLFGKIFGVNDALITSGGDVVKFHPDDNILAMKDFSNLGGGGGVIENKIYLDGREVARSLKNIENRRR